nr:hypothetical protein RNT25_00225 [arsenite-oxidising bacterium NT-25]
MSLKTRLFLCTCVLASGLGTGPSQSQNLGGIINLMGEMIEQDMRNQDQRRRMDAERQIYRERQQAIRREEQARLDEARRQEILLIKRLQTALSKLGFYTSAIDGDRGPGTKKAEVLFSRAFGFSDIPLDEHSISQIEDLAVRGFRSADELREATAAGFDLREDFLAAKAGGFASAQDYSDARQEGFASFQEYRRYRLSGFDKPADYRVAAEGGFDQRAEFEAARAAGFADRAEFINFKASGHTDKRAYEAALAAEAAATAAFAACVEVGPQGDLEKILDICLTAIIAGADSHQMKPYLEEIRAKLDEQLRQLSEHSSAVSTEVASTGETTVHQSDASVFLVTRAKLLEAQRQLECGLAILEESWANATAICQEAQGSGTRTLEKLQTLASIELKAAGEAAEKEAEEKRRAAAAEQQRLALEAAHGRLEALLSDMGLFTKAKRSLVNPLDVAKAVVRLRQLEQSDDYEAIEQALIFTDQLLKGEPDFQAFLTEKQKASEIALVNARTTATADLQRMSSFIEIFVGANLLHESVNDLLQLQDKLASALQSGQDQQIFNMQKAASAEIARLNLSSALSNYVYEENAPSTTEVQQAPNGIAVTDLNRGLLEGDRKDVLLVGNFTPQASHLLVDLTGKTTFDGGLVDYCWIGADSTKPPLLDHVLPALRSHGAETFRSLGSCGSSQAVNADVLLVERGEFLSRNVLDVTPILQAFESNQFKLIQTIAWADVGRSAEDDGRMADTIRNEVLGQARVGFGVVRFEGESGELCLVVQPDEAEFHQRALAIRSIDLERFLPVDIGAVAMTLDRAFASVQKRACKAVYASESDMAKLLQGLQNVDAPHSVLPVWIDQEMISEGRALAQRSEDEKQKEIAARRQELEADAALRKRKREAAEVVRVEREKELRGRYSQESRAAYNDLSQLSKSFMEGSSENSVIFTRLFPELGSWKMGWKNDSWELEKYEDRLVDYGTADWKNRKLEAVIIETSVTTKNAIRGEYSKSCYLLAYLIDSEFQVRRDPMVEPCETSAPALRQWQVSRGFESRWVASITE